LGNSVNKEVEDEPKAEITPEIKAVEDAELALKKVEDVIGKEPELKAVEDTLEAELKKVEDPELKK